jgi:hypothetical protein
MGSQRTIHKSLQLSIEKHLIPQHLVTVVAVFCVQATIEEMISPISKEISHLIPIHILYYGKSYMYPVYISSIDQMLPCLPRI